MYKQAPQKDTDSFLIFIKFYLRSLQPFDFIIISYNVFKKQPFDCLEKQF